jgi:lipopolysaccharide export system ATP-binding protein|tara:strand:+ start:5442 stop:6167 length:726 start_codon:yes stop_codon:yes gene_type:complete
MDSLSAQHLRKSYATNLVIEDVSLNVNKGEIVGLLGPNGAGKTTCFYMLVGLIKPDSGDIKLGTQDLTTAPVHERARAGIGYLPQEASVFKTLSTQDNILAILELDDRLDSQQRSARLEALIAEFSLGSVRQSLGQSLSGGERRRLEIARALASNPQFILLDEPFAGVDPISVNDIKDEIIDLAKRGIGVLITDHNVKDTLDICDRAYIVHQGRIIADGQPAEILSNKIVQKVYLGEGFGE